MVGDGVNEGQVRWCVSNRTLLSSVLQIGVPVSFHLKKEKRKERKKKGERQRERENFEKKKIETQQIPSSCNRRMLALKWFV